MDEEKTNEEVKQEKATPTEEAGDKPESTRLIDDANLAAKRLEEANTKQEELLNRQEELAAKTALGGQSEAGGQPIKKEETPVSQQISQRVPTEDAQAVKFCPACGEKIPHAQAQFCPSCGYDLKQEE